MPVENKNTNSGVGAGDEQPLAPTPVAEWGKKTHPSQGILVELPSGNVVRMRRTMDMATLLKTGRIPNPLAAIVTQMMSSGATDFPEEIRNVEALWALMDLLHDTIVRAFIEPEADAPRHRGEGTYEDGTPVHPNESEEEYNEFLRTWQPAPGKLSVFDIDVSDKMYVFAVAQGAATDLTRFRSEQERALGSLQDGEGVSGKAKRPAGNRQQRRAAAKK